MFDRCYRIDAARAQGTGGAGLGLSIAKWVVEVQGGQIMVADCEEAAAFSLQFPLANERGPQ